LLYTFTILLLSFVAIRVLFCEAGGGSTWGLGMGADCLPGIEHPPARVRSRQQ